MSRGAYVLGVFVALVYVLNYMLLQMETYALLTGSVVLFLLLCVVMYLTANMNNNKEYAKNLFRILREFDENKIDIVFAEFSDDDRYGLAVKNRLYKSAGNKVILIK